MTLPRLLVIAMTAVLLPAFLVGCGSTAQTTSTAPMSAGEARAAFIEASAPVEKYLDTWREKDINAGNLQDYAKGLAARLRARSKELGAQVWPDDGSAEITPLRKASAAWAAVYEGLASASTGAEAVRQANLGEGTATEVGTKYYAALSAAREALGLPPEDPPKD